MPTYLSFLSDIVAVVVNGFKDFVAGIGTGIVTLFQGLLLTGEGTTASPYQLTAFASYGLVFIGITLAIGIVSWIVHKVAR